MHHDDDEKAHIRKQQKYCIENTKRVGHWHLRLKENMKARWIDNVISQSSLPYEIKFCYHKWYNNRLTLRKSISWVIKVPSVLWNSNIIISSWIFDVIVSCTTSPPYNEKRKEKTVKAFQYFEVKAVYSSQMTMTCHAARLVYQNDDMVLITVTWGYM